MFHQTSQPQEKLVDFLVTWHLKDVPVARKTLCLERGLISVVLIEKTGNLETPQNTREQQNVHWKKPALPHNKKLCSELGARYSVLQELEYFDCIRYFVVDPMHNLYLGTAKHMMKNVWLNENNEFLNDEDFQRIQELVDSMTVP